MNPADLSRAIACAAAQVDALRATLAAAGPVEALILLPLIAQAQSILNALEALKSAIGDAK